MVGKRRSEDNLQNSGLSFPSVASRVRCGLLDLVADAFNSEPGEDTLNT